MSGDNVCCTALHSDLGMVDRVYEHPKGVSTVKAFEHKELNLALGEQARSNSSRAGVTRLMQPFQR